MCMFTARYLSGLPTLRGLALPVPSPVGRTANRAGHYSRGQRDVAGLSGEGDAVSVSVSCIRQSIEVLQLF